MIAPRVLRQQRSRRNVRMARLSSPSLETLERRLVLSSVSWTNPNGGDWNTASNWSSDAIPTAADDVTISIAVANPITHDAANADLRCYGVTSDNPIVLSAGTLSIDRGRIDVFGDTVTLSGGTLSGGQDLANEERAPR